MAVKNRLKGKRLQELSKDEIFPKTFMLRSSLQLLVVNFPIAERNMFG
jgi:hypothetical protein